jgi:Na+-translocating ferredoxin:NAD+ oxidoreductase RnfE subunit
LFFTKSKTSPISSIKLPINKLASPGVSSKGSRAEMEKHFGELPAHIKSAIIHVFNNDVLPNQLFLTSGGAFLLLGFIIALINYIKRRKV